MTIVGWEFAFTVIPGNNWRKLSCTSKNKVRWIWFSFLNFTKNVKKWALWKESVGNNSWVRNISIFLAQYELLSFFYSDLRSFIPRKKTRKHAWSKNLRDRQRRQGQRKGEGQRQGAEADWESQPSAPGSPAFFSPNWLKNDPRMIVPTQDFGYLVLLFPPVADSDSESYARTVRLPPTKSETTYFQTGSHRSSSFQKILIIKWFLQIFVKQIRLLSGWTHGIIAAEIIRIICAGQRAGWDVPRLRPKVRCMFDSSPGTSKTISSTVEVG